MVWQNMTAQYKVLQTGDKVTLNPLEALSATHWCPTKEDR